MKATWTFNGKRTVAIIDGKYIDFHVEGERLAKSTKHDDLADSVEDMKEIVEDAIRYDSFGEYSNTSYGLKATQELIETITTPTKTA